MHQIHKEKGQALLEFLTPEDASAALSFDGRSFCGSIIKIRRPKDFIEVAVRMISLEILSYVDDLHYYFLMCMFPLFNRIFFKNKDTHPSKYKTDMDLNLYYSSCFECLTFS